MNGAFTHIANSRKAILFLFLVGLLPGVVMAQTDTTSNGNEPNGLIMDEPSNVTDQIEYDPISNQYIIQRMMGDFPIGTPIFMSPSEYQEYSNNQQNQNYWENKTGQGGGNSGLGGMSEAQGLLPQFQVGGENFDRLFGGNTVDIRPRGSASLIFGGMINRTENPALPERNRRTASFNFDEQIQMNVTGSIGDKLRITTNYDTEATFSFENQMKLEYTGDEDEIIQRLEVGNVSLPLNSTLITGAQSLFGVKAQMKFGKATVTSVFSEQKSETSTIDVEGGARTQEFEIRVDEYEANRHFFLSQFFRDRYDEALEQLPVIVSGVEITKIEVWVTNRTNITDDTRNIVGFMDLGEAVVNNAALAYNGGSLPDNSINTLNPETFANSQTRDINQVNNYLNAFGLREQLDYSELETARRLRQNEYTFNPQLGYISLNQSLNADEVLGVSFQYTFNGQVYQVGEFSNDGIDAPQALMVKLLKSTIVAVNLPMWDLMMKNVYSIGAFQVNQQDFRLDVLYANDATGQPMNFIPEGSLSTEILLRVLNVDKLNNNNDPQPDGVYDFVPGITINPNNGRIFFPVVEPFGEHLRNQFAPGEEELADRYVYQQLYDSTKFVAQQDAVHNKFLFRGSYRSSSSSEIPLNAMNVPQGSVTVTAGGQQLIENVHYTVDYNLGRVKIIDEGLLNSGTPIQISLENNSLFNFQAKRFMGTHVDYEVSKDLMLGGTILNLGERPLTQKVNMGDEPINNTIWGLNGNYTKESRFLTRMVDALPGISTNARSTINVTGEFAQLIPGSPKGIKIDGNGTSYIDDFENSQTTIDIRTVTQWQIASTPQGQDDLFPEANLSNDQTYGYNRAKLAWYVIDPLFHQNNTLTPDHIRNDPDQQSNHFVREVLITELFPAKDIPNGQPTNMAILNMAFYPSERGPYNFEVDGSAYSAGLNADGSLAQPKTRWGGIMRNITQSNFETANIEFIQMWILDPFVYNPTMEGGDLYINLGNISEDILRDNRKSFENGLPETDVLEKVDSTAWGHVPTSQSIVNAFANDPAARERQDIGLDGLNDIQEGTWPFNGQPGAPSYLDRLANQFGAGSGAYLQAANDPGNDNYHYYRGSDYDNDEVPILERYKQYNNTQGNSPVGTSIEPYPTASTTLPDVEDINQDQTLSKTEAYYQYRVSIRPQDMQVGTNYITDVVNASVKLQNGQTDEVTWYQLKIPIFEPEKVVGNIFDFRSIRFMRMFYTGFDEPLIMRFARLEFVRSDWRRFTNNLAVPGEDLDDDADDNTVFDLTAVNLEENGQRSPIPYVIPPGIERQILFGTTNLQAQNEQSLSISVCELEDGDARAAFKNLDMDMRNYNRIKMFVHAESSGAADDLQDGDLTSFMRLGSDFTENYYEYEIPVKVTPWGTSDPDQIWPQANEFDFDFNEVKQAKLARNDAMKGNADVNLTTPFTVINAKGHRITVVGNPNLSNVRTIMLGMRNPKKLGAMDPDDGLGKCAEFWFNELRLSDFDQRGGYAATMRAVAKLADFGTVSLSGSYSTVGFGGIDKAVQDRNKEEIFEYNLQTNLNLGQFFGNSGIRIPMYYGFGERIANPMFNELDPDIETPVAYDALETTQERDSLKEIIQDYTRRQSINFTNVRKERTMGNNPRPPAGPGVPRGPGAPEQSAPKKEMPWDIENFSVTYSYNETFHRDVNTEYSIMRNTQGQLAYNYNTRPQNVRPFKNINALRSSQWLRLFSEANFYYLPSRFAFQTNVRRDYSETKLRNNTDALLLIEPNYNKAFTLDRVYDLKYDLTKNIKIDYSAISNNRIDEPEGAIDDSARDSIWTNFWNGGRSTRFHQTLNFNWNLPVNMLPITDWTNVTYRYTSNYDWNTASITRLSFGNTIQNSNTQQWNVQLNFTQLYNKVGFLKRAAQPNGRQQQQRRPARRQPDPEEPEEEDEEEEKKLELGKAALRVLMMVKNGNVSYSETNGTLLPGYLPGVSYLGMTSYNGGMAPTLGFVFGDQTDIRDEAALNGWITQDTLQPQRFAQTRTENLNLRVNIEPIRDFRIELTGNRTFARNFESFYRYDPNDDSFVDFNPMETGNLSISFLSWNTSFEKINAENGFNSDAYNTFLDNRLAVATQLALDRDGVVVIDDSTGFPIGFGPTQQDVLIPSFLAAYQGKDIDGYSTQTIRDVPLPNWRITYDGLMKIPWIRQTFRTVTLSHAYRSTYTVGNFQTDLRTQSDPDGIGPGGNYYSEYQIQTVSIREQFSPLIKIDVTLNNSLTSRVEMKRDRTMNLSFANNQITEMAGQEYIFGVGYRFKEVPFRLKSGGRTRRIVSDLNVQADVSIRQNRTLIRKIVEGDIIPTGGQSLVKIQLSADYVISRRFNVRFFFDRVMTNYVVSTAFPTANTNFGVEMRFTLGQ